MKTITIDEQLYAHIAAQTKYIGESASDILRRLLLPEDTVTTPPLETSPSDIVTNNRIDESSVTIPELDIDPSAILACTTVVERFLLVLSAINAANPASFAKVLNIKGKGRDYFATSKEHLLSTGSSTNPKAIPNSDYWVVTNNNTSKKASILRLVCECLGYDQEIQTSIAKSLTLIKE